MEDPGVLTSDDQAVFTLSAGFVNSVRTPMDKVSEKLEELKKSQEAIITSVHEAGDFSPINEDLEYIHSVFHNIVEYTYKLQDLKGEMKEINEHLARLKKRSTALQQKKIQAELVQADRIEKELQRERELNAKPAKSLGETAAPPVHREPAVRQPSVPVILPPSPTNISRPV